MPLVYDRSKPHSADFYTQGKAQLLETDSELAKFLDTPGPGSLVVAKRKIGDMPAGSADCLQRDAEFGQYVLFEKCATCCEKPIDAFLP